MYILKTQSSFDAAHFLYNYNGKCRNVHGHRWNVIIEAVGEELESTGQSKDMLVDFGELKSDLRKISQYLDHSMIIEKGSLKETTLTALREEGFNIIEFDFRPTAERLANYFYEKMSLKGYKIRKCSVYETPDNCATYLMEDL